MPQLVSVRFRFNPKALWFDPQGKTYTTGSEVLVETERGREAGTIVDPAIDATEKQISKLKSPLKPVIRKLTQLDHEHIEALDEKGRAAMPYFRQKVEEYELDIKPVEVQYLFSGDRAVFFFSSEERVDFRELVRDLAQHFHVRIDMRQIGARDEAKELGGLAHCGEEFCCTRFGGEFQPVSIRMAKEQDLPLNPTKISGVCGRLMCCLRYEYEAYKDFKKRAPKKGTPVDTPLGEAVISGYNTPSEMMELRLQDGKKLDVPLAEMACHKGSDGCQRCSVNHETIERCASSSMLIALGSLDQKFDDILAAPNTKTQDGTSNEGSQGGRKRRRRSGGAHAESADANSTSESSAQKQDNKAAAQGGNNKQNAARKRRRRGGQASSDNAQAQKRSELQPKQNQQGSAGQNDKKRQQPRTERNANQGQTSKPRPGQNSSGLRKRRSHSGEATQQNKTTAAPQHAAQKSSTQKEGNSAAPIRQPRRRHSSGGQGSSEGSSPQNSNSSSTKDA